MALSPLMPIKAYALFAGMAVLALGLVATALYPAVWLPLPALHTAAIFPEVVLSVAMYECGPSGLPFANCPGCPTQP